MYVNKDHIDFGTVFPQEWRLDDFVLGTSTSFCADGQLRVTKFDYSLWVEWKPDPAGGYYPWLGDCLYLGIDAINKWPQNAPVPGDLVWVGAARPSGPPGAIKVMDSTIPISKVTPYNLVDRITVGLDVPVFEGFYNQYTDIFPTPAGLQAPTVVILKTDTDRYIPDGVTLGVDIKIQIERIFK